MKDFDGVFLSKFEFLKNLDSNQRRHIFEASSYKQVCAGTVIYSNKHTSQRIVFVLSGEFKVYTTSESGRKISLFKFNTGEVCALSMYYLNNAIASISVVAMQDSVIAEMPYGTFCYLLSDLPYIQHFFINNTANKFCDLIKLIERLAFKSVTQRLWDYMLAKTMHGKNPLYKTHAQIATALGTSREVVTRRLNELKDAGLIKIERGKLLMLEPKADISNLKK